MPVAPRRRDLGRLARHRAGSRRHDDRRLRVAHGDLGEHAKLWGAAACIVTLGPALPPASAVTPASKVVPRALWAGGSPGPGTSPPRSCMLSSATRCATPR